ncbi:MAG: diaminopimelate decarboxylase [Rhodospirillales bacterium]|nr:diaminopimelate decarboxylase [Rhodospirillales bacterium]
MNMDAGGADPSVRELVARHPALRLHAQDGLLLEDVPLAAIADALGTPAWVYGAGTIRARLAHLRRTFAPTRVHYAVKANDHLAVLRLMAQGGAGADVVSEGEMRRALAAGIAPAHMVFSGTGKTRAELEAALAAGVGQINAESAGEIDMIAAAAAATGRTARVALRINPDVAAGTHDKISTGRAGDKFGIPWGDAAAVYTRAAALAGVEPVGLALHIGSQIVSAAPYRAAWERLRGLTLALRQAGLRVARLDAGGGLGITYRDEAAVAPEALAGALREILGDLEVETMIEPGRWLVAPAGVLLASVVLNKEDGAIVVIDAAMNDLARPAMYGAWHGIVPLDAVAAARPASPRMVAGPVCESSDIFARARPLPPLAANSRVAILDAGAYGAVMSSLYNARPLAPIAMVDGARWTTIRERQPLEAMWAGETIPDFLSG